MNVQTDLSKMIVGYDVPALPGMDEADIQTPALVLDLDALERNIKKMGDYAAAHGMRHRVHGKMHKSVDVAKLQERLGGAVGVCCQKVSEAEVFVRGGIKDVLVSNQVRDPMKIDRLAQLPTLGSRIIVCVDDLANVAELSAAAQKHGTQLEVFVEIDCGAGRCGVTTTEAVVEIAQAVDAAEGLKFTGIQAYQGAMQHMDSYEDRKAKLDVAIAQVQDAVEGLKTAGIECELVSGGGTGSYYFESNSGVYNELQCGSYAFMDADYGRILDKDGKRIDQGEWENAFFILTQVMSHAKADKAIVDAGLKAQSVDSGLPVIFGRDDVEYVKCSDEHGVVADPDGKLAVGEKLRLVPGHCDPTANVHDWYVGVRNGKVETLWPVSARGKAY
ncbi:3-hydroxy-D-aspartate aldolase [Thalassovita autumnalis]|uniref:3-hydroxy-D-aspartate aldolase n=1 Tax=Thalassovita autumnalis TaxID=2072972 RepID=A0A0P1FQK4_9RHOB|nr:3-hydroxy-D-aspartate aldolase BhcC [Thalassovita autumnalis]CUH63268.1 3-hydroxy-D-aspartate aldolase [Thalassovita autumnalis]CUH71997.1 3-hydroxy-D-aspartate aldolase [Thalassovita autumnalis]